MCGAQQLAERGSKTLALALIPPWFICNIEGRAGKGRVSKKNILTLSPIADLNYS